MKVIIHSPESEEALKDLELRIAQMKVAIILHRIQNLNLTCEQNNELIAEILRLLKDKT